MKLISANVYEENGVIFTLSDFKKSIYGEKIIQKNKNVYREWNPKRSKIAAALFRKLKKLNIKEDSKILYLGCASGTTLSHISDIAKKGIIFALDKSEKEMRIMHLKLKNRNNIAPILDDANNTENYKKQLNRIKVDFIIQDVASPNQTEILIQNAKEFLNKDGELYFSLKTKSISQIKEQKEILEDAKKQLTKENFEILKSVNLRKYEDNHWLLHLRKNF